ncbi:MAG: hypothetical protein AAF726_21220 [Planctomycetota bacterium]
MGGTTIRSTEVCSQPVDVVWNIVTDASAFHALFIPHVYEPFDTSTAQVGTEFRGFSVMGSSSWRMFVTDWEPMARFGFGSFPGLPAFAFDLEPDGSNTRVTFTRVFHAPSILERTILRFRWRAEIRGMCEETTDRLSGACARLYMGKPDGLERT